MCYCDKCMKNSQIIFNFSINFCLNCVSFPYFLEHFSNAIFVSSLMQVQYIRISIFAITQWTWSFCSASQYTNVFAIKYLNWAKEDEGKFGSRYRLSGYDMFDFGFGFCVGSFTLFSFDCIAVPLDTYSLHCCFSLLFSWRFLYHFKFRNEYGMKYELVWDRKQRCAPFFFFFSFRVVCEQF